jgi:hypothetical protein
MQTVVDSEENIKAVIQVFLSKPDFLNKSSFAHIWRTVMLKNVFDHKSCEELNNASITSIFDEHILPNIKTVNDIFYNYLENSITDNPFRFMFRKLVEYASFKQYPIIPIINSGSHCELIGDKNVILFKAQPIQTLIDLGIQVSEQFLYRLAHELGHCVLHFHYQSSFKTREKQTKEYKLFNESMAWHVANYLLLEHCSGFNSIQLLKQQIYSLLEYQKDPPMQKSQDQLLIETSS